MSRAASIMSAIGQPALMSGMSTVLSGQRISRGLRHEVNPQKTITIAAVAAALRESSRESPTKSAMSCTSAELNRGEYHRAALGLEFPDIIYESIVLVHDCYLLQFRSYKLGVRS